MSKKRSITIFCTLILIMCFFTGCSIEREKAVTATVYSNDSNTEETATPILDTDETRAELNLIALDKIDADAHYKDEISLDLHNIKVDATVSINAQNDISVYKSSPFTQEEVNTYIKMFDEDYDFESDGSLKISDGFGLGKIGFHPKTSDPAISAGFLIGNFVDFENECGYISYHNVVTPMEYEMRIENMYEEVYPTQAMEYEWFDTKEKLQNLISLSEEEAIDMAKEFLFGIDITDMQVILAELKPQKIKNKNSAYYDICFSNTLNNNLPSHGDIAMSATMYSTVSKYSAHCIDVAVDERGVIGFRNVARKEKIETLQEDIKVIAFENAIEIIERNIGSALANYPQNSEILIDKIILGTVYVPIDDQTMKSTPVWDFEGKVLTREEGIKTGYALPHSIIRVNAIDGSIV